MVPKLSLTCCLFRRALLPVLLTLAATAGAQVGLYGMGSGGHISGPGMVPGQTSGQSGGFTAWGGTFGIYDGGLRLGPAHLGGDGRFFTQNSGNSGPYGNKVLGVLAGPRLSVGLPPLPFRPYVQAEIGLGATNYGVQPARSNHFAYQIQGGLDFTVFPRLDLRGEYGAGQIENSLTDSGQTNLQEFGIGLVLRL